MVLDHGGVALDRVSVNPVALNPMFNDLHV